MRDAQSLLEQILSYAVPAAGEEKGKVVIDETLLEDILGIAERKILYDLSGAVIQGDAKRCVELVGEVMAQGHDITRLSRELVEHFRNLLVVRLAQENNREAKEPEGSSFSRLLDLPDQEINDLKRQASALSVDTLTDYFNFMAEGDEEVARSSYPRFALEAGLVRLTTLPKTMPISELLDRLEKMEKKLSRGERAKTASQLDEGPPEARPAEKESLPQSSTVEGNDSDEVWKKFIAFVMREKKFLASYLERVRPLEVSPGQLKIGVEERLDFSYLQDPENLSSLKDLARRFFSQEVAVGITSIASKRLENKDEGKHVANAESYNDQRNDIVRETLRIFGGSVKGVKRES